MKLDFFSFFFFFKQKTAYEMSVSDWSSDVCSSDLMGDLLTNTIGAALMGLFAWSQSNKDERYFESYKIGRASCRERV